MNRRQNLRISVIGAGASDPEAETAARELGRLLAERGHEVVCGGLGGVMRAVCQGARQAGGLTIGILPGADIETANEFVAVPVATGLGIMRNALVVGNGAAVIAVEGESGTLSEIAIALKTGKAVIAIGRWSGLPGVRPASSAQEAVKILDDLDLQHLT